MARKGGLEMVRKSKGTDISEGSRAKKRTSPDGSNAPRVRRKKTSEPIPVNQRRSYVLNYNLNFLSRDWRLVQELKRYFIMYLHMGFHNDIMHSQSVYDLWVEFSKKESYGEFCTKAFGGRINVHQVDNITLAGEAYYFQRLYRECFNEEPASDWDLYWAFSRDQERKEEEEWQRLRMYSIEDSERRYGVYLFSLIAGGDVTGLGPEFDVDPSWVDVWED